MVRFARASTLTPATVVRTGDASRPFALRLAGGTLIYKRPVECLTKGHTYKRLEDADYVGSVRVIPVDKLGDAHAWKQAQTFRDAVLSSRWNGSDGHSAELAMAIVNTFDGYATKKSATPR